jgi:hypothetical protein
MKIGITPDEPIHLRVRYNGEVVHDEKLVAGQKYDLEIKHPTCCGKAEAFFVEADGSEFAIGSTDYGACKGSNCAGCSSKKGGCGSPDGACRCQKGA